MVNPLAGHIRNANQRASQLERFCTGYARSAFLNLPGQQQARVERWICDPDCDDAFLTALAEGDLALTGRLASDTEAYYLREWARLSYALSGKCSLYANDTGNIRLKKRFAGEPE